MIRKVLIANRGEIALRIIRACQEAGLETVAVYSQADTDSLHVRFADEAVCIGPPASSDSYLNINQLLSAAEISAADAIHPGYGFLAENANFAEMVESLGFKFIGPPPQAIAMMGDKALAKRTMKEAGVPVTPGSEGVLDDFKHARQMAAEIGYPVMIKATAGGGGRGMRLVRNESNLETAYEMARSEAEIGFNNPDLYIEKFIENPRHIEIQILADSKGNVVYLGERDCSIQRRHQKLIEESPSPAVTPELRRQLGEEAVRAAKAAGYESAGTVEFLLDKEGNFYFMEMNTRIQVEHPVTEMVTGMDLLKEQLYIAMGRELSYGQEDIRIKGHAIECRINAEDPDNNFLPNPGLIESLHIPGGPGVRVDTHIYQSYVVPPFYDSLLAKLICWGNDREEARVRLHRALEEMVVEPITTTIPFHLEVVNHPNFIAGDFDTGFLDIWKT
ncbi:MAG: acetyl-CoA carboxylase biotin carboxylase subunit [candidate division Zixibacteria bacterium]|nr:acetyl-CoA carboxylase biotin carboxylase subunit [Candidatus Tariuqbacter arcticus]